MKYTQVISKAGEINQRLGTFEYRQNRSLEFAKGKKILNFGSGKIESGNHKMYASLALKITSVDNDEDIKSDFESLKDVTDNDYDVVVAEHVLEHIPVVQLENIAGEIFNLLKADGIFYFTVPFQNSFCFN